MKWEIAAALLCLTGCQAFVDDWQIESTRKACEARGGVREMNTFTDITAICRDGARVKPTRGEKP